MNFDEKTKQQIKEGRSKFIAMATTYFLGVFNDNYFKQAAMLMAVAAGLSELQGTATQLFSLPFILFSTYAGWFADRYAKRNVIIGAKTLELIAMICGAIGILTINWNFIMAMVFIMALQSTIFSPALNGSIPELYPEEYVTEANAVVKLVTTVAILVGIALAGVSLEIKSGFLVSATDKLSELIKLTEPVKIVILKKIGFTQLKIVAFIVIFISLIGLIASYFVNKHKAEKDHRPFPWYGPVDSVRDIFLVRKDPPLFFALFGSFFFYTVSSLAVLVINKYGVDQLGFSKTLTSMMIVALMIGICIGSFVVAQISTNKTWTKMPGPSTLGFGIGFIMVASASYITHALILKIVLFLALIISGTFAGMLLIPITSFIQVRPAANEKGKILGAGNFLDFSGIFFSGLIFKLIDKSLLPSASFYMIGFLSLVIGVLFKYIAGRKNMRL